MYSCQTLKRKCQPHDTDIQIFPSNSTPMQSVLPGKCMSKMTERAKLALEEQCKTSKKRKNGGQITEAVPKKVRSDPQTGTNNDTSIPSSPAPVVNRSHSPTVEDVDDDDEVSMQMGKSSAMTQSPEPESDDDKLSMSICNVVTS